MSRSISEIAKDMKSKSGGDPRLDPLCDELIESEKNFKTSRDKIISEREEIKAEINKLLEDQSKKQKERADENGKNKSSYDPKEGSAYFRVHRKL